MSARPALLRRLVPWVLGTTLAVLAVLAITRIFWLREQLYDQVRAREVQRLEGSVRGWEGEFLGKLDGWLDQAATRADAPAQAQAVLRQRSPWIESIALWRPARPTRFGPGGTTRAEMLFPQSRVSTDWDRVTSHPCMLAAKQLPVDAPPRQVADAYLVGCVDAPVPVRLQASMEAATLLERAARPREALDALELSGVPDTLTLDAGLARGIPADRLVALRNRRAELLMGLGREEAAINLYVETGQLIAELDAPDAQGLETWRWALLDELEQHDRPLARQRLEVAFQGLDRRIRAWREITTQVLLETDDLASSEPRLIRDQYADRPYLLYYGIRETGDGERIGVALQLDQDKVLADFLGRAGYPREDIVITDASGDWVLGARRRAQAPAVSVPFARTLTHLRAALHADVIQRQAADLSEQWIIPLIVTTFILILGFFALSAQIAAQRRLAELLARQREFTTRVTHELKTPIAGIKVMAENLELGAFKGEQGRTRMARRIVEEADRLTSRIDEVLAATRERTLPTTEVFDLEEILFELIDVWGPRYDQHGVVLEADLDEAPEVRGDREAVRDAVGCLLDNALKYRDEQADPSRVWLTLEREGRQAVVRVTDNGLGVPPRQRKRIFEKFARVEGPNRGRSGGHGLGLAQVAATARAHGGAVVCTDGVDGGATFTLTLRGVG